ncbi:hypothetical protein QOT17_023238 [Balamuthia mandrillaris]
MEASRRLLSALQAQGPLSVERRRQQRRLAEDDRKLRKRFRSPWWTYNEDQRRQRRQQLQTEVELHREQRQLMLPQDWRTRSSEARLAWLQEKGQTVKKTSALRSLWSYVHQHSFPQTNASFAAWQQQQQDNAFDFFIAEVEAGAVTGAASPSSTASSLLPILGDSLKEGTTSLWHHVKEGEGDENDKTNKLARKRASSKYQHRQNKHKQKDGNNDKSEATAATEAMSPLEEKLMTVSLLAPLVLAFSVDDALHAADEVMPFLASLLLHSKGDENDGTWTEEKEKGQAKETCKKQRRRVITRQNAKQAAFRSAVLELHAELQFVLYMHDKRVSRSTNGLSPFHEAETDNPHDEAHQRKQQELFDELVDFYTPFMQDEESLVRIAATRVITFFISLFSADMVHNCFHEFFHRYMDLLEDVHLKVRVEAADGLAVLLLLNEEEAEDKNYYEVGSHQLLELEEKVKELCWKRDFAFDKQSNSLQFKTFKRLRTLVEQCRKKEEQLERTAQSQNAKHLSPLPDLEAELSTAHHSCSNDVIKVDCKSEGEEEEAEVYSECDDANCYYGGEEEEEFEIEEEEDEFFNELRLHLGRREFYGLQQKSFAVLDTVPVDSGIEWHVRNWRTIVQLKTLRSIVGPSFTQCFGVRFCCSCSLYRSPSLYVGKFTMTARKGSCAGQVHYFMC